MLTLEQHFASGFLPASTGAYFNLLMLLSRHADSPLPGVRDVVRAETVRLKETGKAVADDVRQVQALAELAGVPVPSPPRTPADYFAWLEAVRAGFGARLEADRRPEIAHRLGHDVGNMLCSWNVTVLALRLLVADPDSRELARQVQAMRDDVQDIRDDLLVRGHHPNAPPALATLADRFSDAVDDLMELDLERVDPESSSLLGSVVQAWMEELDRAVVEARTALEAEDRAGEA